LADDTTTLDGRLIEKWALKTLFNLGYLGALDRPTFARLLAPADIISCLFSDAPIPEGAGIYLLSGAMTNEKLQDRPCVGSDPQPRNAKSSRHGLHFQWRKVYREDVTCASRGRDSHERSG
jgi:hypothetical protein